VLISYSEARQFRQCQRKWFFKNVHASWNAKDPSRREAFVLSKLQSLNAWRGTIVDKVLSTTVLPRIQQRGSVTARETIAAAQQLFDVQHKFASLHRVREPGLRVGAHGDAFAAWHDVEYGEPPSVADLDQAWMEIETSLQNALAMTDLIADLRRRNVIVQPRLFHDLDSVKVTATPDVAAFGRDQTVKIIDWKVHSFGLRAAKQQLALYAGVLHRGQRQTYFPFDPRQVPIAHIALCEVQLLNNEIHDYTVTDDDIDEVFDEIFESAELMRLARGADDTADRQALEFTATPWVESCIRCSFKKICRESAA
jgi:PD-(D/E)XK nuclease superfamily